MSRKLNNKIKKLLIESVGDNMIGPFYHETDNKGVRPIRKEGITVNPVSSISPGSRINHNGPILVEVVLTEQQMKMALEETVSWVGVMDPDEREEVIELLELSGQEFVKKSNQFIKDPGFMAGELICPFNIPLNQLQF